MTPHKLRLEIDHLHEKHGWMDCYLTFDESSYHIDASGAMPPFQDLLDFLRAITLQRLPAWFFWDEEGRGPYFEAWPLANPPDSDCPDFLLRIIYAANDIHWTGEEGDEGRKCLMNQYKVLWVDSAFNRETIVNVFLESMRDFVLYAKDPDHWRIHLSDLLVFENLRARNIPPRCDITRAEPLVLIISRNQDEENQYGSQHLELHMWDMMLGYWRLDDTDAFWPQWFDLLENALNQQPYEMTFIDMFIRRLQRDSVAHGWTIPDEVGPDRSTRILAVPLNHPRHFRLQIFETDYQYTNFLKVDEVIDIFQLVSVFLKEFEGLLNQGYQPYPDEDGLLYDLRQLPVERLKKRISSGS